MKTLELKDLAPYFPHKLHLFVIKDHGGREINKVFELSGMSEITLGYKSIGEGRKLSNISLYKDIKPLMLPLSAMTEQLPDGSVPIVELAKIHDKFTDELYSVSNENDGEGDYFMCHYLSEIDKSISCHFVVTDKCDFQANALFHNTNTSKYTTIPVNNQLQLFEYLYQHHFWLGDQSYFDEGLIIDKRTVKSD